MRNSVLRVGRVSAALALVLVGCGTTDGPDGDTGKEDGFRTDQRLGTCRGVSRVNVARQSRLIHSTTGMTRVVVGDELTLEDVGGKAGRAATLTVEHIQSAWTSSNWNIFSAGGTVVDERGSGSVLGRFDIVVGPNIGVLWIKTDAGEIVDFYRMACDAAELPRPVPASVAAQWNLHSRVDDVEHTLTGDAMLPAAGDELVLASDDQRRADLTVTSSVAMPFGLFASGTYVDRRRGDAAEGTFELVGGSDITVLLMRAPDGTTWDFFGGDAVPDPRTQVSTTDVASCVVVAANGTFRSARPPKRGDRLRFDPAQALSANALRFNGGGANDPSIPLDGPLRRLAGTATAMRYESPAPGRVGTGLGVDLYSRGAGNVTTMWISQNLLAGVAPRDVSLALLACATTELHATPALPQVSGLCQVAAADGAFGGLSTGPVRLSPGDGLEVASLGAIQNARSLTFSTALRGMVTIGGGGGLARVGQDAAGVRYFGPDQGGVHVDVFAGRAAWIYHKVGTQWPVADATWTMFTCPASP